MKAFKMRRISFPLFIFFAFSLTIAQAQKVTQELPVSSVWDLAVNTALNAIVVNFTDYNQFDKNAELLSVEKIETPPFVTSRLIFKLEPPCSEASKPCIGMACIIDIKQNKLADLQVLPHSLQCTKLYLEWKFSDIRQKLEKLQETQIISSIETDINHQVKEIKPKLINDVINEKSFIAVTAMPQKYCPGCPYKLNIESINLEPFSEKGLESIDNNDANDYKHKLISIISFSQSVPFSSLNTIQYDLIFQVGETMCKKDIFIERSKCTLHPNLPLKTCYVKFLRPFNSELTQVISNNCTEFHNDCQDHVEGILNSSIDEEEISRTKFDQVAQEAQQVSVIPASNEKYKDLNQADSQTSKSLPTNVEKFKEFDKFLDDFFDQSPLKNKKFESRHKRNSLLGGFKSIEDLNDPVITNIVQHGLKKYSETLPDSHKVEVLSVKKAEYQIVAGIKYIIDVDVHVKNCMKELDCQNLGIKSCKIAAISKQWLSKDNLSAEVKCGERLKRSLRGVNYSQKMLKLIQKPKEELLFDEFINTYNKSYPSKYEKQIRFKIFKENLDIIEELQRNEQGTARYGINQFADITQQEFKKQYLGLRTDLIEQDSNDIPLQQAQIPDAILPPEFDWRHYNVVTPVKNQEACGSCWAFSVTGNIESQYAIKHGKLYSLSEQELLDCDKLDEACNGGLPDSAYRAIEQIGGLETESDYPYEARKEKCHFDKDKAKVRISSAVNITTNETQIAQWLVKNGPVSIGINANAMQFYVGGVSHPFKFLCSPSNLDHGVLIVGYGVKNYPIFKKRLPYWIIKNSWGPHWGEQGYYRVYRGDGTCGVNKMVTSAVVN